MNSLCHRLVLTPFILSSFIVFADIPTDPLVEEQPHWDSETDFLGLVEATHSLPDEKGEVLIALCMSGINLDHEDLAGRLWINEDEIPDNKIDDDENGWIDDHTGLGFYGGDLVDIEQPQRYKTTGGDDHSGTGSFVAGLIGAIRDNGLGGAGMVENVKFIPIRGPIEEPRWFFPYNIRTFPQYYHDEAINYAIDQGADICVLDDLPVIGEWVDVALFERAWEAGLVIVIPCSTGDDTGLFLDQVRYDNIVFCPVAYYGVTSFYSQDALYMDFSVNNSGKTASASYGLYDSYVTYNEMVSEPGNHYFHERNMRHMENLALVAGAIAWTMARFPDEDYRQILTRLHDAGVSYNHFHITDSEIRAIDLSNITVEDPGKAYQRIITEDLRTAHVLEEVFPVKFSSSSGLPVGVEILSGPVELDSMNRLCPTGEAGLVQLRAFQEGDAIYRPAEEKLIEFEVVDIRDYQIQQEIPSTYVSPGRGPSIWDSMALNGNYILASCLGTTDIRGAVPCAVLFHQEEEGWKEVNQIPLLDMGIVNMRNIVGVVIESMGDGFVLSFSAQMADATRALRGRVAIVSIAENHQVELEFLDDEQTAGMGSDLQVSDQLIQVTVENQGSDRLLYYALLDGTWSEIGDFGMGSMTRRTPVGGHMQLATSSIKNQTYVMEWTEQDGWTNKGLLVDTNDQEINLSLPNMALFDGYRLAVLYSTSGVERRDPGRLELFTMEPTGKFAHEATLVADDAFETQDLGYFSGTNANPVAMNDRWIVIGSPVKPDMEKHKPQVYVYNNDSGEWREIGRIQLPRVPDTDLSKSIYSPSLTLSGDELLIAFQDSLYWVDLLDPKKRVPTIEWSFPNMASVDWEPIRLQATSGSGTKVSFEVIKGDAYVEGQYLVIGGHPGEVLVSATAAETWGYEASEPLVKSLLVTEYPVWEENFEVWCLDRELPVDSSGPMGDPDDDGIINLIEYTLNGDPKANDSARLLQAIPQEDEALNIQFSLRNDGTTPRMFLEFANSPDFKDNYRSEELFPVGNESGSEYLLREFPVSLEGEPLFYRIRMVP